MLIIGSNNPIRAILHWMNENGERIAMYTIYIFIILVIGIEVVRRFALSIPSQWGEETARLMYVYLTWIGASWGIRKRAHIRIDIIHEFISERSKNILYIFYDLLYVYFSIFIIQTSIPQVETLLEFGSTTQAGTAPLLLFFIAIPVGGGLMIVRSLQMMHLDVNNLRNGNPAYEGEELFGGEE